MTLFFDAKNLLNTTNIAGLSPNDAAFLNPNINAAGDDYAIYYTETGRAGGAYLQDSNGTKCSTGFRFTTRACSRRVAACVSVWR